MKMVHERRDGLASSLEKHRANPDKLPAQAGIRNPGHIQEAHSKLAALQNNPIAEKQPAVIKAFQDHVQTMHPGDIRQFQKESGMRGKTADTIVKEAHIAAQERSIFQQKCRREGISVAHFKQAEAEIRQTHNKYAEEYNSMLNSSVGKDLRGKIREINADGGDYVTLQNKHGVKFDLIAEQAAAKHPEYFSGTVALEGGGKHDFATTDPNKTIGHEGRLWDYALAGNMQPMRKSESFIAAFDKLKNMKETGGYSRVRPRFKKELEESPF